MSHTEEIQQKIQALSEKFFRLMAIEVESLEVVIEDEERPIYRVCLKTQDSKLVIGIHGQTLETIKHLLTRMIEKSLDISAIIHLEVNDYMQSKDEKLFRYIDGKIDFVVKNQRDITLPNLTPYERKKVHNYISEKNLEGVKSFSEGEGKNRVLHLSFIKPAKMELEEDGVGI